MQEEKRIRKNPLFEVFVEDNHLIVHNTDYLKDNCAINLKDVLGVELIRSLSFFDKIIEFTFGVWGQSKSDVLRINFKNGFKDIVLTDCDIKKTEVIIYKINQLIIKQDNNII